jgi:predicted phage terminase large subunit-like protein
MLLTSDDVRAYNARENHLSFMRYCWCYSNRFAVGKHTRAICVEIDAAMQNFADGVSTFVIVTVPFRHGKSEIISVFAPPHWLGRFPTTEVLLTTYGQELADDLSRKAKRVYEGERFRRVYPDAAISKTSQAVSRWETSVGGKMAAAGLGGPMTGRGYSFGIVDDFVKNRQEAESALIRDRTWESFTNDFLTRRAPVSATIVLATRWHMDDLIGRIMIKMAENAEFPRFRYVNFPAWTDQPDGTREYLFPERFTDGYYRQSEASLGVYDTAALLLNDPRPREGNILKTDRVKIISADKISAGLRWVRAWDLASTKKELVKSDPDWTVGFLMAVETVSGYGGMAKKRMFVKDEIFGRWEAPERDRRIVQAAEADGPAVAVATESVAGYKDTFTRLAEVMRGIRVVEPVVPPGDLMQRAAAMAPIFEAGEVYFVQSEWNARALKVLGDFPSAAHDDEVAALSTGFEFLDRNRPIMGLGEYLRKTGQITPGMRGEPPDERYHIRIPTRRA